VRRLSDALGISQHANQRRPFSKERLDQMAAVKLSLQSPGVGLKNRVVVRCPNERSASALLIYSSKRFRTKRPGSVSAPGPFNNWEENFSRPFSGPKTRSKPRRDKHHDHDRDFHRAKCGRCFPNGALCSSDPHTYRCKYEHPDRADM
jgi:hypothetical protein